MRPIGTKQVEATRGETVKAFRTKWDLTQPELACALRLTRTMTVHDWEAGNTEPPPYLTLALERLDLLFMTSAKFRQSITDKARERARKEPK